MSVWRRAALLVATSLVMILVLLLLAEAAVRIRNGLKHGGFWGVDETYEIDPASGLRIPIPGGHFGAIRINTYGFRSPEISKAKPPGRLRIAFLGGSTTYCAEVSSNAMTWPNLVWQTLHRRWPKLDLDYINAGVPGYSIRTLLPALKKRVAAFQPDIIVIYEATNDLSSNTYDLAHAQGVAPRRQESNIGWFGRHSLLVYLIEKNLEIIRLQRHATDLSGKINLDMNHLDSEFRQDYVNLVSASQKVAKIVVAVTFSMRLRPEQSLDEKKKSAVTSLYFMPYMTTKDLLIGFAHYNQVIREVAGTEKALLVGGENTIPGDAKHFVDSVHFSDAGSVAMADRVANALIASPAVQALVAQKLRAHAAQPPA